MLVWPARVYRCLWTVSASWPEVEGITNSGGAEPWGPDAKFKISPECGIGGGSS